MTYPANAPSVRSVEIEDIIVGLNKQAEKYETLCLRLVEANNRLRFPDADKADGSSPIIVDNYPSGHIGGLMRVRDRFLELNEAFENNLDKTDSLV